ncbi:hypothetical protein ABT56_06400 [Photobacterium aquae]|uniref:Uncharacterized protein n=1 Tax=Photobacterium aquae TaxID=1195763 RepID=A0A0J1JY12_9GAMM|nr:NirD/YgiW/YdeI family stress tolerance protein [Photobacterium aquae]KLV07172.1 hypothetical protein ABT56_06400 [Photobacterium aquae]
MKKQLIVTLGALLLSSSVLAADNSSSGGGFQGPSANDNLNTVEDVMNASWLTDGTPVTLVGHLTHSLGNERYLFADDTGNMPVKIDDDEWNGQTITPKSKIQINGVIEKDDSINAVDANTVQILNN